ncbi:MAG: bile acid:sodium symporter family protein [Bacteroidales bacterium]|nr:bile acid:sodium symporter family protein [Bacteroidales bacterium]
MAPEIVQQIDSIVVTLNAGGMNTINIILAFVMYGVALGIQPRIFVDVFKKPKLVLLGMLCQLVLLPLFTFLLAWVLGPAVSFSMAMGMILVASCPGGNISNFISSLSKANIELSVSLTAISTALAMLMTPFNFWLYGNLYIKVADLSTLVGSVPNLHIPFWDVFKTIVILLGIPLTLGMLTAHFFPKAAEKMKKPFQWFSIIFFLAMVVLSFVGNITAFLQCVKYIFLVVFIHNALALSIGYGTGSLFKVGERDRRTMTIETGIQNSGLGLALMLGANHIFANFMPDYPHGVPGGMLVITAWWGIWHIIAGLSVAGFFNLKDRRAAKKANA